MEIVNDKYAIISKLGSGGQGDVYLAKLVNTDYGLEKKVVLKFFPKNEIVKKYFVNEVKILSKLDHQNIISIIDAGETEDKYFLVLEYFGISLKEFCEKALNKNIQLPEDFYLYVGSSVIEALKFAHTFKGGKILHKDVSPQNILISEDGRVKLIDFGISELEGKSEKVEAKGKKSYLPVSVINGTKEYDETTDFYSLGETLRQLTTNYDFPKLKKVILKLKSEDLSQCSKIEEIHLSISGMQETISNVLDKNVILENTEVSVEEFNIEKNLIDQSKVKTNRLKNLKKAFFYFGIFWTSLITISIIVNIFDSNLQDDFEFTLKNQKNHKKIKPPLQLSNTPPKDEELEIITSPCEVYCDVVEKIYFAFTQANYKNYTGDIKLYSNNQKLWLEQVGYQWFNKTYKFYKKNEPYCSHVKTCKLSSQLTSLFEDNIINGGNGITPKDRFVEFFTKKSYELESVKRNPLDQLSKNKKTLVLEKSNNGIIHQLIGYKYSVNSPVHFFHLKLTPEENETLECTDIAYLYYFFLGNSLVVDYDISNSVPLSGIAFDTKFNLTRSKEATTLVFEGKDNEIQSCAFVVQDMKIKYENFWSFKN